MSSKTKPTPFALGAALAGGLVLSGSAFAMQPLAQGYMLSSAEVAEGSCGGKTAEGSCGSKGAEGSCGADKKAHSAEGRCGLEHMDADKDGRVSRAEFAAAHQDDDSKFASHDTNGDGFLTAEELKAHMGGAGGKAMEEGKCGEGKCGAAG